jgi:hypothetical protein
VASREVAGVLLVLVSAALGLAVTVWSLVDEGPAGAGVVEVFFAACFFVLFAADGFCQMWLRRRSQP